MAECYTEVSDVLTHDREVDLQYGMKCEDSPRGGRDVCREGKMWCG
jgi:hypothetical protein